VIGAGGGHGAGAHGNGGGHPLGGKNTGGGARRPPMIADGNPMQEPHMLEQTARRPPHRLKGEGGPHVGGAQEGGGQGMYAGGAHAGGPPAAARDERAQTTYNKDRTTAKTLITIPHPPLGQILHMMLEGVKLKRRTLNMKPWRASLTRGFNMGLGVCQAK